MTLGARIGFQLTGSDKRTSARAGELTTPHGTVATPAFLPVGSQGTVKALTPGDLTDLGASILLGNAYHLYLRPCTDVIERCGGLHRFMAWEGPILTDSGGYQVFSLAALRRIDDRGIVFRSHIDGSEHSFSPELAMAIQEKLGADIIMALDECPRHDAGFETVERAVERTYLWAERCLQAKKRGDQALFGIVQGGVFPELRRRSASFLGSLDFPGYAIGGLSLGERKEAMWGIVEETVPLLPAGKPRYLMGVGSPEDLVEGVARGIDLFDSALPTRVARNGGLYTRKGRSDIKNAAYREGLGPFDAGCDCYTCRTFPVAYLHHLFKSQELLAYRLASLHNLRFIMRLMQEMRESILRGDFSAFRERFHQDYRPTEEGVRLAQKEKWLEARGSPEKGYGLRQKEAP